MASKVPLSLTSWACVLSSCRASGFYKLTYLRSFMLYINGLDYEISALSIIKNDATDVPRGSPHFKLFFQKEESAPLVSPFHEPWFGDWINRSRDSLGDPPSIVGLQNPSWFFMIWDSHWQCVLPPPPPHCCMHISDWLPRKFFR